MFGLVNGVLNRFEANAVTVKLETGHISGGMNIRVGSAGQFINLDAIAATPGVDGVFIGPADLSASMGHVGNPGHPEVQAAIEDAIARILRAGKAPGILTSDETQAGHYLTLGALFVAVGLDTQILARQTSALAARFKAGAPAPTELPKGSVY